MTTDDRQTGMVNSRVLLTLGENSGDQLRDLARWLSDDDLLRGRVHPVTGSPRADRLGGPVEALELAAASLAMLTATLELAATWLSLRHQENRSGQTDCTLTLRVYTADRVTEVVIHPSEDTDHADLARRILQGSPPASDRDTPAGEITRE